MRRSPDNSAADGAWWRDAVCYQVYLRSFADSDGDGIGDLDGVRARLGYLELLGVDALWLTPFHRSPMIDHGYDISDHRGVDPVYGTLDSFDALLSDARKRGLKVIIDLVVNHSSSEHEWFLQALREGPGSRARDRYVFRDGRGADGAEPPNNWPGLYGGPAWTRVADGQWYLHLRTPEQPDLNPADPEVLADLELTMRFWLDRGVDGFRVDAAHLVGPNSWLDVPYDLLDTRREHFGEEPRDPRGDNDAGHDTHRLIRKVLDDYPDRVAIGDVWIQDNERFNRYLRADELHAAFNYRLAHADFGADTIRAAIENAIQSASGAAPTWVLSNHDLIRGITRYGDDSSGRLRARAMALVEFALPGLVCVYNGEELGLPSIELPEWALQDPIWKLSRRTERGRDGSRMPIPWEGQLAPFGFSTGEITWLPVPQEWGLLSVERQVEDPDSMLSLYRQAMELRATHPAFTGQEIEWYGAPEGCFAFRRRDSGLICALNASGAPIPLPPGELLLASAPVENDLLPNDSAAWLV